MINVHKKNCNDIYPPCYQFEIHKHINLQQANSFLSHGHTQRKTTFTPFFKLLIFAPNMLKFHLKNVEKTNLK